MSHSKCHLNFTRMCHLLAATVLATVVVTATAAAQQAGPPQPGPYNNSIFGPNVYVLSPSLLPSAINSTLNALNQEAQFSTNRYAVLFQPGIYGAPGDPVTAQVGFYEQMAGLGTTPADVNITGGFYVDQLISGNMTQNFWRSQENMTEVPAGGLTNGVLDWGVSQGASLRRMNIQGGLWYANSGPINGANACQEASGGFTADTQVSNLVNACSQQQWYTRNSNLAGGFTGYVWNFVFSGVVGNTPAQSYPGGPGGDANVTKLPATPVSQEKPFIYMDNNNNYNVFVPNLQTNSSNTSWSGGGRGPGYSLPISSFFIATPSTSLGDINNALANGLSLILTPGIYQYSGSINVTQGGTIVLGMGYATLVPQTGTPALTVADVSGVIIAGLLIDAGPVTSPMLLELGDPGVINNRHAGEPTVLNDVFFRIGGAVAGSTETALQVDSGDVILDNIWAWRADHGNSGTVGWTVNTANHGLVVNGSNVTALGLAVEHFQKEQVQWNGDAGETIFYQSELPYDPPSQAAWSTGTQNGYPSYVVTPGSVCTHTAYGLGIYSYFDQGVNIVDDNAMTVPAVNGVNITDVGTVFLNGSGQISNIINGTGGVASVANSGTLNPMGGYDGFSTCTATTPAVGSTVPLTTISTPNPNNLDAANVVEAIFTPHSDLVLLAAHRGIHSLAGLSQAKYVPENSLQAIGEAAKAGWEMIELDVKLTYDGVPILSHDRSWGREWCSYNANFSDVTPYDPFVATGSDSNNDGKDPLVANTPLSRTRWWYFDNTVLRDSVSLITGGGLLYRNGCSTSSHSVFSGVFPPTLQDVYDYIRKNKIHMAVALDIQGLNVAHAAWNVVQGNNDDQGRPFSLSTVFKMPATLFPNGPNDFYNTFGVYFTQVNFIPVITTSAIAPVTGTTNVDLELAGFDVTDIGTAGFGNEQAIINWLYEMETADQSGHPIEVAAVEVGLKEPSGILSTVLEYARRNLTGRPSLMSIGQFNPVGEYYPPDDSNTNQTPQFFRSSDGSCCDVLAKYLYNNPNNTGPIDPSQPVDNSDQRTDLNFIIGSNNQYIITDDPSAAAAALGSGRRNISYMQTGYTGTGGVIGNASGGTTPTGPAGYIYCGNESSTCTFAGTAQVAFGASGSFYYQTFTNSASCNVGTFGDPDPGVAKSCYYQLTNASSFSGPYTYCASENQTCSFAGTGKVGFGANQSFTFQTLTGGTSCSVSIFGDPAPGVVKACYFYQSPATGPAGYIYCGGENSTCTFAGTAQVAFGASGSFYYQTFTNSASCNVGTFGDPDPGVVKGCYYQLTNASSFSPPETYCASENQTCSFAGTGFVAFGANGSFNYQTVLGGILCSVGNFGDPAPGVVKACYYSVSQ